MFSLPSSQLSVCIHEVIGHGSGRMLKETKVRKYRRDPNDPKIYVSDEPEIVVTKNFDETNLLNPLISEPTLVKREECYAHQWSNL